MRKQFDIKYRSQIESGEYKVETQFGGPVEIVCWNRRDDTANKTIVGIIREGTVEEIASWNIDGKLCDAAFPQNSAYDLFIVMPEPELTEFENAFGRALMEVPEPEEKEEWYPFLKEKAAELLSLARKQLQLETDALKDLPRWKKIRENGRNYSDSPKFVINGRYLEMTDLLNDVYEVALSDLVKLPRFKKDEK